MLITLDNVITALCRRVNNIDMLITLDNVISALCRHVNKYIYMCAYYPS